MERKNAHAKILNWCIDRSELIIYSYLCVSFRFFFSYLLRVVEFYLLPVLLDANFIVYPLAWRALGKVRKRRSEKLKAFIMGLKFIHRF